MRVRLVGTLMMTVAALVLPGSIGARVSAQSRPPRAAEAVEEPGPPAWRVHAEALGRAAQRLKEIDGDRPRRRARSTSSDSSSDFDGLTAAQVEERIAPARQAL